MDTPRTNRLDPPVDDRYDHVLGASDGDLTLVEFGSYACPYCRAANEEIGKLRDRFGSRLRYVFRQRPLTDNEMARLAADLVETASSQDDFWRMHVGLMTRSPVLTEEDLAELAADPALASSSAAIAAARARVDADIASAAKSGVRVTPTFFINGRRYEGPWDEVTLSEAMLGSLGHRVQSAALDFAGWAPAAGLMLLVMSLLAIGFVNSPLSNAFTALWEIPLGFALGSHAFEMSLAHWINDALLTIFFLVVGLEIKREFTVGRLANRRSAAFPIAAALGGMVVPASLYLLLIPAGPWQHGWGVPMATDTAFAVAIIAMMGRRVPVELRVFLTAAAIVDDLGSIVVVALFYSSGIHFEYLAGAGAITVALALLNRSGVYRALPYWLLGVALWACVHAGGLHATLAGVILALFIPTRPPPNFKALTAQARMVLSEAARAGTEVLRRGLPAPAMRALDAIYDRLESPAARTLRALDPRSSFIVLPLFALANAGVVVSADAFAGREQLALAIGVGLLVGKPVGLLLACALAVWSGVAVKPDTYSWRQLAGAGLLAGIGFTMSLFISGQAFADPGDFAAAKLAIFGASVVAALLGVAVLWRGRQQPESTAVEQSDSAVTPL